LAVLAFQKSFQEFQKKYYETIKVLDTVKDFPRIIERVMPLLIHFQVCEGLRYTLGDVAPAKLLEFETKKLNELQEFGKKY